jgi:hypothetical protein
MIKMYIGLHLKYPVFVSDYNKTCILSRNFGKSIEILRTRLLSTHEAAEFGKCSEEHVCESKVDAIPYFIFKIHKTSENDYYLHRTTLN